MMKVGCLVWCCLGVLSAAWANGDISPPHNQEIRAACKNEPLSREEHIRPPSLIFPSNFCGRSNAFPNHLRCDDEQQTEAAEVELDECVELPEDMSISFSKRKRGEYEMGGLVLPND